MLDADFVISEDYEFPCFTMRTVLGLSKSRYYVEVWWRASEEQTPGKQGKSWRPAIKVARSGHPWISFAMAKVLARKFVDC